MSCFFQSSQMLPLHLDKQYFKIIVLRTQWELRLLSHSQTSGELRGLLFAAETPRSHISRETQSGGLVPATRRVSSPSLHCCRASAPLGEHTRKRNWSLNLLPDTLPTQKAPPQLANKSLAVQHCSCSLEVYPQA